MRVRAAYGSGRCGNSYAGFPYVCGGGHGDPGAESEKQHSGGPSGADDSAAGYDPEYSYSTGAFAALNSYEFIVQRTYDGKAAVINVDDINTENVEAGNCREFYIKISDIDLERKLKNSDGFEKMCSNGYFCQKENIYLSTEQFLDRMVSGDWDGIIERQQEYVNSLALNPGTCGEKVHEFVMNSLIKC